MQLDFRFGAQAPGISEKNWLMVGPNRVRLHFIRHRRARRYVLRLRQDGSARVTIPNRGSIGEATRFVHKHIRWLERHLLRQRMDASRSTMWEHGTQILFRGQSVRLELIQEEQGHFVRFGTEKIGIDSEGGLRHAIEQNLWRLAARELPERTYALAALHGLTVNGVTVRNQRSRWGSCSRRATISLNWRLIQTPDFVRDYIILHELAHLREMNHSPRFWSEVAKLSPGFAEAERWLKKHAELLR
jgi:predicted metal-dependent hydrolase